MSQQDNSQGNAYNSQPPVTVIVNPRKNSLGTSGMVISILGLFLGLIPFAGWLAIILGFLFSLIGVFSKPRGRAIAGLIISVVSICLWLFMWNIIFPSHKEIIVE